jgi:hypothetical protein
VAVSFLPYTLPAVYSFMPGITPISTDVDVGGYDLLVGGHGFRLATDTRFPYSRGTDPVTVHRFDSSLEPGEQTLSPLPWIKSQSSFHGGAGQLNLEQGFTAFQYQQEQVEHVRFDASLGIDCWTPGQVSRLPDTLLAPVGYTPSCFVTAASAAGVDSAVLGGAGKLQTAVWSSGPDAAPTISNIDLTGAVFGGAANCNVTSLTTDGSNYYGVVQLTVAGSTAGVFTIIISGVMGSATAPKAMYDCPAAAQLPAVVGWAKQRLMAGVGTSMYELVASAAAHTALPVAKYTSPTSTWLWTAISESPSGVLTAGQAGSQSSILELTLDTSAAAPVLLGGATVAVLPLGERVVSMGAILGSFLAIGTTTGVRIASFDTYTGSLKYGPKSLETTSPVYGITARDRFVYAGYSNQQEDGKTGVARIDLSMVIDAAGRNAWAADMRPPTSAPTGLGTVVAVGTLPASARIVFVTPEGIHVEGNGAGSDGDAWIRTSRIRYDTAELKLFKLGRIHGTLDIANIQITGISPFASDVDLGTFGFISNGEPGEFRLTPTLTEWIQLKFDLAGSSCILNSYQVKAIPAPKRQNIVTLTANCFRDETDRYGLDVTDPETPRQRYQNVVDLMNSGEETRLVEFTNSGSVAQLVVIDDLAYQSFSPPSIEDDFGGYITFKLRATE